MQKIIALVIVLFGVGGGLALGVALRPGDAVPGPDDAAAGTHSAEAAGEHGATEPVGAGHGGEDSAGDDGEALSDRDYVTIGRQIIIPIVKGGKTQALMLFDLALDVPSSMAARTQAARPRLRDAFLRELFKMSYTGAFSSTYTDERVIEELRAKLRAVARRLLGDAVAEVLILDIMRQEL